MGGPGTRKAKISQWKGVNQVNPTKNGEGDLSQIQKKRVGLGLLYRGKNLSEKWGGATAGRGLKRDFQGDEGQKLNLSRKMELGARK